MIAAVVCYLSIMVFSFELYSGRFPLEKNEGIEDGMECCSHHHQNWTVGRVKKACALCTVQPFSQEYIQERETHGVTLQKRALL